MTPRAVIFDLDDTLADTSGTILEAAERSALARMIEAGLRCDFETGWAALREIRDRDPGTRFLRALVDRFGADDPEGCHAAARRCFFASRPDEIVLVEGAREVLASLRERGIDLYLVTFGVPEAQRKKIEVLSIGEEFSTVEIVPLESGPDKTEIFRDLLRREGLDASEVWIVGDRTPGEIRAGNLLGMKTIRIRRGEFAALPPAGPEETPDVTLERLTELLTLL